MLTWRTLTIIYNGVINCFVMRGKREQNRRRSSIIYKYICLSCRPVRCYLTRQSASLARHGSAMKAGIFRGAPSHMIESPSAPVPSAYCAVAGTAASRAEADLRCDQDYGQRSGRQMIWYISTMLRSRSYRKYIAHHKYTIISTDSLVRHGNGNPE